jgi:hypothetical protein
MVLSNPVHGLVSNQLKKEFSPHHTSSIVYFGFAGFWFQPASRKSLAGLRHVGHEETVQTDMNGTQ